MKKCIEKVDVEKMSKFYTKISTEDITWAALKMLLTIRGSFDFSNECKKEYHAIIAHIMQLPYKQKKMFISEWLKYPCEKLITKELKK